jgi:hypothetical protein
MSASSSSSSSSSDSSKSTSSNSSDDSSSFSSDDSSSDSELESYEENPVKPSAMEPDDVDPVTKETVVLKPAAVQENQVEEQVSERLSFEREDEEVFWFPSKAEEMAERINPYPKILGRQPEVEEDYVCREPDMVAMVRSVIIQNFASRDGELKRAIGECVVMINAMYEYNMVSHPLAEAVTGVAVSSEWGPRIMKAAQGLFGKDAVSPEGFVFNEKLPLILVKLIRFANLRAIDIRTVSILCVCHLSVDGCTQCFYAHSIGVYYI